MLSAFSFREFRGINRRAAGACVHLFMCTRVYAHVCECLRGLAASGVTAAGPSETSAAEYSASARFMHPVRGCVPPSLFL